MKEETKFCYNTGNSNFEARVPSCKLLFKVASLFTNGIQIDVQDYVSKVLHLGKALVFLVVRFHSAFA